MTVMNGSILNKVVLSAAAGLLLGVQGCGGGTTPAAEAPAQPAAGEPAEGKHSCSAAEEKNGCGGMDAKKPHEEPADTAPAGEKK